MQNSFQNDRRSALREFSLIARAGLVCGRGKVPQHDGRTRTQLQEPATTSSTQLHHCLRSLQSILASDISSLLVLMRKRRGARTDS
jgi:hypothetical protein